MVVPLGRVAVRAVRDGRSETAVEPGLTAARAEDITQRWVGFFLDEDHPVFFRVREKVRAIRGVFCLGCCHFWPLGGLTYNIKHIIKISICQVL